MSAGGPGWTFHFVANNPALEFADTVSGRGSPVPIERFPEFAAVVSWACQSGLIDEATARTLSASAAADPAMARRAYRRAIRLRDLLYRVFAAIADAGPPAERDVKELSRCLRRSLGHLALIGGLPPYRLDWRPDPDMLEPVLGPVVKAAAELLSSAEIDKVRKCGSPTCGWLFLDVSRNKRRRWCAMWACGNRAKARRFYRRHAS
ncbi:MAG: CGNR zinc finger domain-containing protein [Proteobacteria bacterium]|nr:CGNR zinc finger domain-containing protein [Pseudomonadota bacterium]MBI3495938.1 CGNR zinc finger domain-containing protein [Pseudomonadota bacterium]